MFLYAQNLKLTEDTQTVAHFLGRGGLVCTALGAQPVRRLWERVTSSELASRLPWPISGL